ncbi:hypothetical protein JG687_00014583 [Phytophthora cactorum]|uniref:Uncharacterized protein n=1 Tax=Phytophthora cactorum TaxID=29920 RepID=A0A8T1TW59_9STRA|nr:hypothetical protein JG687_00014583 [Phytophthora cactorum]
MSTYRDSSNPALDGWMLEMFFFASLRVGGLDLVGAAGERYTWNPSIVVVSDGISTLLERTDIQSSITGLAALPSR